MGSEFFGSQVIKIIQQVPKGKVTTYGRVALLAGSPRGARQVSWILNSSSRKYNLPWHRIINSQGKISLKEGNGYEIQRDLLEAEGIIFSDRGKIDLKKYGWNI